MYAVLIGFNLAAWGAVLLASARYPLLLALAPVAYGFGLRHAVDPDHIAAIDNTTRKLMQDDKRPVGVGFYFSLGHSTIVFALSLLIAVSASFVKVNLPQMQHLGGIIGTSVSGTFLLIVAALNLVVLLEIWKTWRTVRAGGIYDAQTLDEFLSNRGLLARLLRPVLRLVSSSWQMYPIGLLFGLGFDTASEIGLLGMSATAGAGGMPVWLILLLPLLFVAGMALVDTTDGVAMLGAYGWASVRPVRKLYYNLNITLASVIIALFIGGIEVLQVISAETGASGWIFSWANTVQLTNFGYAIIGIFMASWLLSVLLFKLRGVDRLDESLAYARTTDARRRAE
jgi:high-affinity nickel-transport protein